LCRRVEREQRRYYGAESKNHKADKQIVTLEHRSMTLKSKMQKSTSFG
jgi:hypothetical protein